LAARRSGIAPAISTRNSGSPPRSMPQKWASRQLPEMLRWNNEYNSPVRAGGACGRRPRLGPGLSDALRRAQSRAAQAGGNEIDVRHPGKGAPHPRVRRENVEESLREIEARRAKARSVPLSLRIAHAGQNESKRQFILFAGTLGIA